MKHRSAFFFLLLSFLSIFIANSVDAAEKKREKITNGTPAPEVEFDDVVAITYSDGNKQKICTGIAVSGDSILTAGHCTCGDKDTYKVIGGKDIFSGQRGTYDIKYIKHYPGYNCSNSQEAQAGFDIGLIKLSTSSEALEERVSTRSIILMGAAYKKSMSAFHVFGYGKTETGYVGQRRSAEIDIASSLCVDSKWQNLGCSPFLEFILSNHQNSSRSGISQFRDSCGGDSGGPVFWKNERGNLYLVGVVSRAIRSNVRLSGLPCGGGGIYSVVGRHSVIRWLQENNVEVCLMGEHCDDG